MALNVRPLLAIIALMMAVPAMADTPETFTRQDYDKLVAEKTEAEQKLAALEAAGLDTKMDLGAVDTQLLAAAMESRRREEQAATSEIALIDLRTRLRTAQRDLVSDKAALEDLLATLASTGRQKPPALIVSPNRANRAVRAAILMGDAAPRLTDRTDALTEEIEALRKLETKIRREQARLDVAEATLAYKKAEIEQLAAIKRSQYEDLSGEAEALRIRLATVSKEAETLGEFLAALEANAPSAPGTKPDIRPRILASLPSPTPRPNAAPRAPAPRLSPLGREQIGALKRPAAGMVSLGYGDNTPAGTKSQGIVFVTRSDAQVTAPVDGRVEYADTFRSYGEMVIVRTADDYLVMLHGMSETYVTQSQYVKAGEPVGRMPRRSTPPPELSMELRKQGKPMNPAKWMGRGG